MRRSWINNVLNGMILNTKIKYIPERLPLFGAHSSAWQSDRLITGRAGVQTPLGPKIVSITIYRGSDSDQQLYHILYRMTCFLYIILEPKLMSNLIHTPLAPHFVSIIITRDPTHITMDVSNSCVRVYGKLTEETSFDSVCNCWR